MPRVAIEGEDLTTTRFPSGSIGLTDSKDITCAVCVSYGTKLKLTKLTQEFQDDLGVSAEEDVTFVRIHEGLHHDGVRFSNSRVVLMHRLGVGVGVHFVAVADYANNGAARPLPASITATLQEVEAPLHEDAPALVPGE